MVATRRLERRAEMRAGSSPVVRTIQVVENPCNLITKIYSPNRGGQDNSPY